MTPGSLFDSVVGVWGAEEVLLLDDLGVERAVADLLEQHGELAFLRVGHRTTPELLVLHRRPHGVRRLGRLISRRRARLAAVTVPARLEELLAEVAEQELHPAAVGLGVA